jgi:hypothetical protein
MAKLKMPSDAAKALTVTERLLPVTGQFANSFLRGCGLMPEHDPYLATA